jgi:tetratricopeptide (TPR) repeat protein
MYKILLRQNVLILLWFQSVARVACMTSFKRLKKYNPLIWVASLGLAVLLVITAINPPLAAMQSLSRTLKIQGQQQSTYSRLVLDLPAEVNYSVTQVGTEIRITIDGSFRTDFSAIENSPVRQIGNGRSIRASGQTILVFDTIANVSPRDFRSGQFLVLDIYGGNPSERLSSGFKSKIITRLPSKGTSKARSQSDSDSGKATVDSKAANTEKGKADNGDDTTSSKTDPVSKAAGDDGPEPIQEPSKAPNPDEQLDSSGNKVILNDGGVVDIETNLPRSESTLILSGISDAVVDADKVVTTSVAKAKNGISIRFSWPAEAASAVFTRGGSLWIIFDQPYSFNPQGLVDSGMLLTERVTHVSQRPHLDALILQLKLESPQSAVVERDQNDWLVYLKDTPAKPRFPLKPTVSSQPGQGQQIFVPASDIGRKVEFEDPDVGDLLIALPMLKQGNGLADSYSYAAAQLLESAQGVIVLPETDFVSVERFQDGIAIRSTGNDILSASQLPNELEQGGATQNGFARLIDFQSWRIGPDWEYRKNKERLFYELSLQAPSDRNDVRWRIARYYLAHGRAAECLGILDMMLLDDPLLERNTDFLAVRGVANFKQGRLKEAWTDLSSRELDSEQDAELWRTLVAEKQGDYEEALELYRRGRDVMGTYDEYDRAEIELAVVRAAIETGNLELAQRELDLINGLNLTEAQVSEQIYQRARIAEQQGEYDKAFEQYDALADAPQRWLSARARYSRIKFGVKNGDLSTEDAIDQLERLRYSYRGDRFEVQVLDDLAGHYFDAKQYQAGLTALQLAVSYHPKIANEKRMLLRQQYVFKQLFLQNVADEMSPIEAISLFNKFTHLTPLGAEGDLLVRNLAQRMVSVDLLGRAAQVLDYQVRERTEGSARAKIAGDLAKIYILDQKPDLALEILRATREPRLPQDIQTFRKHVEARALAEKKRYEEAEVLLEGDRSADAEVLRADIYWGAEDWPRVTTSIRKLLGDGWRRNEPLTALQRLNLVRLSIAMTFAEDRAGLIEMRRRYANLMRGGDFANAFDLLTNDQELSGRELNAIASQIASVDKLQSFMRDYRNDFSGR